MSNAELKKNEVTEPGSVNRIAEPKNAQAPTRSPVPMANNIELAPKPVEEMSAAEIEESVKRYEAWTLAGDIKIKLFYDRLRPQDLAKICEFYLLEGSSGAYRVENDGLRTLLLSVPRDRLCFDLPIRDWPSPLREGARDALQDDGSATLIINKKTALELYRLLAEAYHKRTPAGQPTFHFCLKPGAKGIVIELLPTPGPAVIKESSRPTS